MKVINFIKRYWVILISLIIVVLWFITNYLVDLFLHEKMYSYKRIITEYTKDKHLELNIGNKFTNAKTFRIPFIIYRTWKNESLNKQFKEAWDITAENNPEFQQVLFTDLDVNNFINEFNYPGLKKAYNRINPKYGAARADLFRYAILYKNGGFYMDIKTLATCSIKDKLGNNDAFLLSKWQGPSYTGDKEIFTSNNLTFASKVGEWEQYWLACEKAHPIMKAILDKCIKNILYPETNLLINNSLQKMFGKRNVLAMTGPLMMTYVVDNFIVNNPNFKDFTITRPSFDNCIKYTNPKSSFEDHYGAYKSVNTLHYSQLNEPLLIY